ncbi:MAG: hypothetical protein H6721_20520 [Sandaracinus sp.]|nr:hypothetical protein [Sandaracinus sp.]
MEDVRPGMRGYGLTVFRGTEPERFDVEVVDVLHQFLPGQDLILARTPHPVLNRAIAVGGMSGSPIYLDGKLAGAYAYGWTFGIEPVIGITPIRSMLAEIDRPFRPTSFPGARPLPERPTGRARAPRRASLGGLPAYVGGRVDAFATVRAHREASVTAPPLGLQPAATPLMLAGFTPRMARVLQEELEPYGLMPMQGGGGQAPRSEGSSPRFVDGGALGVQLIRGDMAATGIGTVTHVDPSNGRLVAFGHPMMNAGESGLPTCTARVLHVFQSVARSFKLAEAIEPYGTLVHDRQPAIVVDRQLAAATVPVRIRLRGVEGAPKTEWNVEVASQRSLTPLLVFSALGNVLEAAAADQTDVVYTARYTVGIEGHGEVSLEDRGYMAAGPGDSRALSRLRLFDLMEVAYGNPFEASRVTSVDLELDVRYARDVVIVDEAWIATPEVDPGSDVDVRVRLVRYGQESEIRTMRVHVPESAAGETLTLEIEGGNGVDDPTPDPRNVDDLLRIVRQHYPATSLVASLKMPTRGLRFRGHVVQSLPLGALDTLQRTSGSGPGQPFVTYLRRSEDLGQVVAGSTQLRLQVRETPRERATR